MPNTNKSDIPSVEAIKANLEQLDAQVAHARQAEREELKKQTEQARRVLMRLQWLVIILLAGGLIWLYIAFTSVVDKVDERLVKIDTVDTRLNDIDDRLFALTPADNHKKSEKPSTNQDKEFLKIQLYMANKLFEQGDYDETITALNAINYQLEQMNGVAPAVKSALSTAIKADIAHINTLKTQPDAWQAHIIKMRDLQAFLRNEQSKNTSNTLSRGDILLHDANMMLSLAIGAGNLRDRGLMTSYLQEVRTQLENHIVLHGGKIDSDSLKEQALRHNENLARADEMTLSSTDDALLWVYDLLASSPKNKELSSVEMLK